jgi:hypothetical protein
MITKIEHLYGSSVVIATETPYSSAKRSHAASLGPMLRAQPRRLVQDQADTAINPYKQPQLAVAEAPRTEPVSCPLVARTSQMTVRVPAFHATESG